MFELYEGEDYDDDHSDTQSSGSKSKSATQNE